MGDHASAANHGGGAPVACINAVETCTDAADARVRLVDTSGPTTNARVLSVDAAVRAPDGRALLAEGPAAPADGRTTLAHAGTSPPDAGTPPMGMGMRIHGMRAHVRWTGAFMFRMNAPIPWHTRAQAADAGVDAPYV